MTKFSDRYLNYGDVYDVVMQAKSLDKAMSVIYLPWHEMPKWIPVSERLPEELTPVNITYINTKPPTYYDFIRGVPMVATAVYYKGVWFWWSTYCEDVLGEYGNDESDEMDDRIKVIAWMPLPGPYRGDKE